MIIQQICYRWNKNNFKKKEFPRTTEEKGDLKRNKIPDKLVGTASSKSKHSVIPLQTEVFDASLETPKERFIPPEKHNKLLINLDQYKTSS